MYDYFEIGTRTYFIYNGKFYFTDSSFGEAWKYHKFEVSVREYNRAYRSKEV